MLFDIDFQLPYLPLLPSRVTTLHHIAVIASAQSDGAEAIAYFRQPGVIIADSDIHTLADELSFRCWLFIS